MRKTPKTGTPAAIIAQEVATKLDWMVEGSPLRIHAYCVADDIIAALNKGGFKIVPNGSVVLLHEEAKTLRECANSIEWILTGA